MRDPDRIHTFLEQIEDLWKKNPDLRFGQIISNVLNIRNGQCDLDPFYIEEDKFIELIKDFFNGPRKIN